MENIDQMISWFLNTTDPGSAADYLEELGEATGDENYEMILKKLTSSPECSAVAIIMYIEEIIEPHRKKILPYLYELREKNANTSYLKTINKLISELE